ncbi:transposase zinc-binding domain-containing protein [Paraburkholderia sp. FT54]|nr:transposase zinc-binding domain-containing protein [Paraburkholderia sp. FT54]WNC94242.1 transposase zinc-binding domain-containing protein [Paraburkholderia sp. FT54]
MRPITCGNRHCPKCQSLARADWLDRLKTDLLPVPYFDVGDCEIRRFRLRASHRSPTRIARSPSPFSIAISQCRWLSNGGNVAPERAYARTRPSPIQLVTRKHKAVNSCACRTECACTQLSR